MKMILTRIKGHDVYVNYDELTKNNCILYKWYRDGIYSHSYKILYLHIIIGGIPNEKTIKETRENHTI